MDENLNNNKKKKKADEGDKKMLEVKDAGSFMRPITSFYDAVTLEPALTDKELEKVQAKIYKEVEIACRQVRSSRNLNCNIKNTHQVKQTLYKYLEYLEDKSCLRIGSKKDDNWQTVEKKILKLVPENFKISLFPSFFNTTDGDRIGTVLKDNIQDFLICKQKKVMFSIGVRVFNYPHRINSVRVVILKMHAYEVENELKKVTAIDRDRTQPRSN